MSILKILDELAATASTLEKEAIIRREKGNILLKQVFQAAYNPMVTYGIKTIPDYNPNIFGNHETLAWGISQLDALSNRAKTGNNAIVWTGNVLGMLSPGDAVVLERIIKRDLRCGTSDSIASRVWVGLVSTFDVMLSHKDISGIKFPAYAQMKMDGLRCHLVFDGVRATAWTRAGKEIDLCGVLDATANAYMKAGETWDGELIGYRDGKLMSRKESNGIANKGIKGTMTPEIANLLHFATWDIVDFTETFTNEDRFNQLTSRFISPLNKLNDVNKFEIVDCEIVTSKVDAEKLFEKMLTLGHEGLILKNLSGVWVPKRTKDLGKMKAEEVGDLRITGWYYGEKGREFEHALGGFYCATDDGLLAVNVGGGYSDAFRLQDESVFDSMVGGVMEVTYNAKIQDKKTLIWSLFLPRVNSKTDWLRIDKDVANTLEELK